MAGINELETALNGASRENRFLMELNFPAGVAGDVRKLNVLVKSTAVPGKTRGIIELKKDAKTARIAGDEMTNGDFNTTFLVPKDASSVYKIMDEWFHLPDTSGAYKVEIGISQLDIQNNVTQKWNGEGVFIATLPEVNFDTESSDTIKQFDVGFSIDRIIAL